MMCVRMYVSVTIRNVDLTCVHTAGLAVSEMHRLGARPTEHAYS